ncbi:unnamed protein product, partial [Schistosoma curassoni]
MPAQWSSWLSVREQDRRPWVRIPLTGSWMRTAEESHNRTKRPSSASRFSIVM